MNRRYDLLLGIALLIAVGTGYFFNKNRYFHLTKGEEVSKELYQNIENKHNWRVDWHFNYEAGFTAGLATLGLGLVIFGWIGKSKKRYSKLKVS